MTLIRDLRHELDRADVDYDLIEHRRTETASDEARAIGVAPDEVAKTIVLTVGERYVRAVIPACDHLDLRKVRQHLADKRARLASEAELALAFPMYELGAVPPFGVPAGDRVLFDRRLAERDSVVLEAGSHTESLRMKTADLLSLSGAEIAEIAEIAGNGSTKPN
ncbi:MAG: aminoacyl-tRNA deacylase [Gaiellaceae bacterium]